MMFTYEIDAKTLARLQAKAEREGRPVEALIEEALQEKIGDPIESIEDFPHINDPIVQRARALFGTDSPELNQLLDQMTPDQALAVMAGILDDPDMADLSVDTHKKAAAIIVEKYDSPD